MLQVGETFSALSLTNLFTTTATAKGQFKTIWQATTKKSQPKGCLSVSFGLSNLEAMLCTKRCIPSLRGPASEQPATCLGAPKRWPSTRQFFCRGIKRITPGCYDASLLVEESRFSGECFRGWGHWSKFGGASIPGFGVVFCILQFSRTPQINKNWTNPSRMPLPTCPEKANFSEGIYKKNATLLSHDISCRSRIIDDLRNLRQQRKSSLHKSTAVS